jgi:hypothetical protein
MGTLPSDFACDDATIAKAAKTDAQLKRELVLDSADRVTVENPKNWRRFSIQSMLSSAS